MHQQSKSQVAVYRKTNRVNSHRGGYQSNDNSPPVVSKFPFFQRLNFSPSLRRCAYRLWIPSSLQVLHEFLDGIKIDIKKRPTTSTLPHRTDTGYVTKQSRLVCVVAIYRKNF
ncbi:hypothetical protein TNIN_362731 [Trichonephila inaurata madagascariensis]|uniref:Uncharacterized protein n=1 Tax=Trichonephila inaurata madagascariensis TaxID=2747483 RepID=A0A8X7CQU0_9ARAC|nr:hypothetical protein TNIN_362731 [Trichonephila inaurata madagascariensis]